MQLERPAAVKRPPVRIAGVLMMLALAATPQPAAAQIDTGERVQQVALNGALGGVLGVARAVVAGTDVRRGAIRGVQGGVLTGVGKQMADMHFAGSGLLARQVSAVGISVIHSGTQDSLVIFSPLGPVTLEWVPVRWRAPNLRVNVAETAAVIYYATSERTRLDVGRSLSFGTPVFTRTGQIDEENSGGFEQYRLIVMHVAAGNDARSHELIHVLQQDQLTYLVGNPLERAVVSRVAPGWFQRHVDLGVTSELLWRVVSAPFTYCNDPRESEAYLLTVGEGQRGKSCGDTVP